MKKLSLPIIKFLYATLKITPEYAIYFLIALLPFTRGGVEVSAIVAISAWVLLGLMHKRFCEIVPIVRQNEIAQALLGFLFVVLLSSLFSINIAHSMSAFVTKILEYVMLFIIVIDTFEPRQKREKLIWLLLISGLVVLVDSFIQLFTGTDLLRGFHLHAGVSIQGPFNNPNDLAAFLSVCIIICFTRFWALPTKIITRYCAIVAYCFYLVATAVVIYYTSSRSVWLSLIVVSILAVVITDIIKIKSYRKYVVLVVLCTLILFFFMTIPHNIRELINPFRHVKHEASRLVLWETALLFLVKYPFFGSGFNTYTMAVPKFAVLKNCFQYPHNSYLHFMAETGYVGLSGLLLFLFVFLRVNCKFLFIKMQATHVGFFTASVALLIQAFFDTHFYSVQLMVFLWVLMGLSLVSAKN